MPSSTDDKEFATALSKWLWTIPLPNKDWAEALFAAALDEQGPNPDPHKALAMAIRMYQDMPGPPPDEEAMAAEAEKPKEGE